MYRQKKYADHIVFQDTAMEALYGHLFGPVKERKWFNLSILLTWIAVGGMLYMWYVFRQKIEYLMGFDVFDLIIGCYLTVVLLGIALQLWPLFIFKFVAEEPSAITGQAVMSSPLVMHQMFYQTISFSILVIGLTAYQPSSFLAGSVLVFLMITMNTWRRMRSMKNS
jgi:hypothetical protein